MVVPPTEDPDTAVGKMRRGETSRDKIDDGNVNSTMENCKYGNHTIFATIPREKCIKNSLHHHWMPGRWRHVGRLRTIDFAKLELDLTT